MSVLVIAEHNNVELTPYTLHAVGAAQKLGSDIHIAVIGTQCESVARICTGIQGVSKVLLADIEGLTYQFSEDVAPIVAKYAADYSHILAAATAKGKDLVPRLAALLDSQPISDITEILDSDTFLRPVYAGNVITKVRLLESIKLITVRTTAFPPAALEGGNAILTEIEGKPEPCLVSFVSDELDSSDRPELTAAKVVVAGGRGLASEENFAMLYTLADKLDAAVGASRAAVDAGLIANDLQIGQTGKVVAPDLYIAVGISGAIQHVAGITDSKVIVAINKDEDAPIFQVADYGLVGDLFDVVPQLINKL